MTHKRRIEQQYIDAVLDLRRAARELAAAEKNLAKAEHSYFRDGKATRLKNEFRPTMLARMEVGHA